MDDPEEATPKNENQLTIVVKDQVSEFSNDVDVRDDNVKAK